jgi:predicted DsbA family dithiol-disulfide isomerase
MKKVIISTLLLALVVTGCSMGEKVKNLTIEEANAKALTFINESLMQPGNEAEITEVVEENGLFKMTVSANGQEIVSYLTMDGAKFFPQVMDVDEVAEEVAAAAAGGSAAQPVAQAPKSDEVKVELFVMAFCPYGVIAEDVMAPVYELLGDKVDINLRFIASIAEGDNDINNVKSLHGPIEGIEDARQLCIEKNYGKNTLWKYVSEISEKCYPIYRNGDDVFKACWQTAARNAGVNISKVDSCVNSEGADLIRGNDTIAKGYGVSGSPSLLINGAKIQAARNPEAYKQAICGAFNNAPSECDTVLEGAAAAPAAAGGCGN